MVVGVVSDVSKEEDCKLLVNTAVERFGRIDCLVLNAGISMASRVDKVTHVPIFRRVMDVNYFGSIIPTYLAIPHLQASRGKIAVISSIAGLTGIPNYSGYSASKYALHGFFDCLRMELRRDGVTVTTVCPGAVDTQIGLTRLGPDGNRPKERFALENGISADRAASLIADGLARGKRFVVFDFQSSLIPVLRPLFPDLVDSVVERGAKRWTVTDP